MSTMAQPTKKWAIFDNGLVRPIPDGVPVTRDMFPHIRRDWYVAASPDRPHVRVDPRGPQDPNHMVGEAYLSEREDWPYALEVSPGSLIEEPRVVVIPAEEYRREYMRDGRPARPDYDWERRQREKARMASEGVNVGRPEAGKVVAFGGGAAQAGASGTTPNAARRPGDGAINAAPSAPSAPSDSPYQLRYETDDSGRMVARVERLGDEDLFTEFAYDEGGRLTEVRIEERPVERYTYDAQARRLHEINALRGLERDYIYSPDGRLLRAGETEFGYDDLGMLRSKSTPEGRSEYRYSPDGQLLFVQRPDGVLVEYSHDAYGRRSEKRVAGTVVERYRWNGLTQLVAFEDHSGPAKFEYHRQRMPYAMLRDGKRYWLYYDQIGSLKAVVETVDDEDRIVKALHYDAFGTLLADSNPDFTVPLGYGGGLPDRHTGLVRFGFRDYDPDVGRWTAKDPIGYAGGDNDLYGYCLDDPINGVDPEGLTSVWDVASKIGAGFGRLWDKAPAGIGKAVTRGVKGAGEALSKTAEAYAANKDLQKYTAISLGAGLLPFAAVGAAEAAPLLGSVAEAIGGSGIVRGGVQAAKKVEEAVPAFVKKVTDAYDNLHAGSYYRFGNVIDDSADAISSLFPGPPAPSTAGYIAAGAQKIYDTYGKDILNRMMATEKDNDYGK